MNSFISLKMKGAASRLCNCLNWFTLHTAGIGLLQMIVSSTNGCKRGSMVLLSLPSTTNSNEPIDSFATEWELSPSGGKLSFRVEEPKIPECDEFPRKLIRRVWDVYKGYSAIQLSRMTHEPGTPWAETPNREVKVTANDDNKIKEYFLRLKQK